MLCFTCLRSSFRLAISAAFSSLDIVRGVLGVGLGGILAWGNEDSQSSVVFQLESCECDGGTVGDRGMGCVFRIATGFDDWDGN